MATKKTIAERFAEECGDDTWICSWFFVLRTEFRVSHCLDQHEVAALAKKIINRAFDVDFTRAEVEEFLRS